jgi:DNA invertase Pin-like site-specific DNA recombinase
MDNIIISQYLSGKSSLQIAKILNISKYFVLKILDKNGIERRHQKNLSQESVDQLLNDYKSGMTIKKY